MESLNILFTGKDAVEVRREPAREVGRGEILVETQRSLISTGTEGIVLGRKFEEGTHWANWINKYPHYPGYCNAGTVLEAGPDVKDFKPGDRIASRSAHGQYVVCDPASPRCAPIPDGVSVEAAAWFGMACIVQIGVRRAEHRMGDSVVVIGLGLLGQLVTQYVQLMGARHIIAVDTSQPRLDMALSHGATHVLKMGVEDARQSILDITDGALADVVYDVTGFPAVLAPALGLARDFGTLLLLGDAGTPSEQRLTSDVVTRGVRIVGGHDNYPPQSATRENRWTHRNMATLFFDYLLRGQMRVEDLITHRYAPADAPAAYHMLQTDRSGAMGVVFDWSQV